MRQLPIPFASSSKIKLKVKRYHEALSAENKRHYAEMKRVEAMWFVPADELIKDDDPEYRGPSQ